MFKLLWGVGGEGRLMGVHLRAACAASWREMRMQNVRDLIWLALVHLVQLNGLLGTLLGTMPTGSRDTVCHQS